MPHSVMESLAKKKLFLLRYVWSVMIELFVVPSAWVPIVRF